MPNTFPRSVRRLNRESSGRSWWMPLALTGLLAAWIVWALVARVTVYAVSDSARLEVEQAACPVEASLEGRVTTTHIVLGADVRLGEVLVELDAEPFRLEAAERRATRAGLAAELAPLHDEIQALQRQATDLAEAAGKGSEEIAAEVQEAEAALALAQGVVDRAKALRAEGVVSAAELARVQFDLDKHRAGVGRLVAAKERLQWDRRAQANDLLARLAECRHREAVVQGECAVVDAAIARLEHEVERRLIRAPLAGRLGETANLRAGQFVAKGARLATIVPTGGIKVVAAFRPQDALGRIRSGQSTRLRLHGFAWTQYGFVPGQVASFACEALAGTVRVESNVAAESPFPIALQHGWPGTLEVEVEQVSPATLVLRAAGAWLAGVTGPAVQAAGDGR